jgi:hypothetical protein
MQKRFDQSARDAEAERLELGRSIITRLQDGKLPQMVDWFDPGLLAKVGVRSVISSTLGSYTDQRLIQAATDDVGADELKNRYDYSETGNPDHAIEPDADGSVWVDYIADLGDGFEATYAMAYLLAADRLKVQGEANPLPAGKLLVMGGDQVYPDATKQEYHARLRDPYDWAFYECGKPYRKLFAIPGNHDWYDGLSAFSALFCSARDRISRGKGVQIGGWRCYQHRSYFAIKLPHNWWIWGPDIQLADNLDDSQRDYFDLMSEQATEGHKIILCLAEPSWLHQNYDNMHEISLLARQHGAKICAVIAGDWHHYSRYSDAETAGATEDKLNIQFVTCGGGGAFAHATHGLKPSISLNWARRTNLFRSEDARDPAEFNRTEKLVIRPEGPDFTLQRPDAASEDPPQPDDAATAALPKEAAALADVPEHKPSSDLEAGPKGFRSRKKRERPEAINKQAASYTYEAIAIYPPKLTSRLLCLKNLFLPFRNRPFTYLVGIIYFIYAWAFVTADPRQSPIVQQQTDVISEQITTINEEIYTLEQEIKRTKGIVSDYQEKSKTDPSYIARADEFNRQIASNETALARQKRLQEGAKTKQAANFGPSLSHMLQGVLTNESLDMPGKFNALIATSLGYVINLPALMVAGKQSPMFALMLLGLWMGLVYYVESSSKLVKFIIGTMHASAHVVTLLFVSWFAVATGLAVRIPLMVFTGGDGLLPEIVRIGWNIVVALFFGGLLGGFVMGLYWTLTSTLFNMHTGDAFGALGLKNYKHFLRIKLEPDRATIYPIALDTVPGRRAWRWQLYPGEERPAHNPQILPKRPLSPRLIEKPIKINVAKVSR